jgi:FkbM family methyltransferase
MLTTKQKVWLASRAYDVVSLGRRAVGQGNIATVSRGGLRWRLDLSEGIDFAIYLLAAFEGSTVATLQKLVKPGDAVFDIGANIGGHTLGMARSVGPGGKVYAFEPADFAFEKLKTNLALNPELNERTYPQQILLAASASEGRESEIYASWPLETKEAVHPKHRGALVTTKGAVVDTLDDFTERTGIERLNLIKMDVDGNELPVLQGGLNVLKRFRPILVMELSPYVHREHHHDFGVFVELLREAGYSLQDADKWKPLPMDAAKLDEMISDGASINAIGSPLQPVNDQK